MDSNYDAELVEAARKLADERYVPRRHQMFSALRTHSGAIVLGAHVEASNGRMTVCAESAAIANAAVIGDTEIKTIVAVTESGDIVSPCGMCRTLIRDYGRDTTVLIETEGTIENVPISELLPRPYRSEDYPNRRE